jgi:hypothetical protein
VGHAEAGWIAAGQQKLLDLDWLVAPGSVRASLLTGMLGFQPEPTRIEVIAWLLYAVPMLAFVLAPNRVRGPVRATAAGLASIAVSTVFVAGLLTRTGEAATAAPAGARPVAVSVTDAGCPATLNVPAGPAAFAVTGRSSRVTELEIVSGGRILGEAENLAPGITGRFSLPHPPGRYQLVCTGGRSGTLVATG